MTSFEKDGVKRSIPEVTAEAIGVIPKPLDKPTKTATTNTIDEGNPW